MKHKNDYTCIAYFTNQKPKKWTYVHNLGGFTSFLNKQHSTWLYFNVYERRTSKYLRRFYQGNYVPTFLSSLIFIVGLCFFLTFNIPSHQYFSLINDFNNTATIPTELLKGGTQWK
jgi:hypothetical protein